MILFNDSSEVYDQFFKCLVTFTIKKCIFFCSAMVTEGLARQFHLKVGAKNLCLKFELIVGLECPTIRTRSACLNQDKPDPDP